VRYERVFEVQALTCGKVQTTQGQCHYSRHTSYVLCPLIFTLFDLMATTEDQ